MRSCSSMARQRRLSGASGCCSTSVYSTPRSIRRMHDSPQTCAISVALLATVKWCRAAARPTSAIRRWLPAVANHHPAVVRASRARRRSMVARHRRNAGTAPAAPARQHRRTAGARVAGKCEILKALTARAVSTSGLLRPPIAHGRRQQRAGKRTTLVVPPSSSRILLTPCLRTSSMRMTDCSGR